MAMAPIDAAELKALCAKMGIKTSDEILVVVLEGGRNERREGRRDATESA
jgi:hypothetical protein